MAEEARTNRVDTISVDKGVVTLNGRELKPTDIEATFKGSDAHQPTFLIRGSSYGHEHTPDIQTVNTILLGSPDIASHVSAKFDRILQQWPSVVSGRNNETLDITQLQKASAVAEDARLAFRRVAVAASDTLTRSLKSTEIAHAGRETL